MQDLQSSKQIVTPLGALIFLLLLSALRFQAMTLAQGVALRRGLGQTAPCKQHLWVLNLAQMTSGSSPAPIGAGASASGCWLRPFEETRSVLDQ